MKETDWKRLIADKIEAIRIVGDVNVTVLVITRTSVSDSWMDLLEKPQ